MPLGKRKVAVPLNAPPGQPGGGLGDGTEDLLLAPPGMSEAVDVEARKDGVLEKQHGSEALNNTGFASSLDINSLHAHGQELFALQPGLASGLYRRSQRASRWVRTQHGGVWPVTTGPIRYVRKGQMESGSLSVAYNDGLLLWAWNEATGGITEGDGVAYYMVQDLENRTTIVPPTALSGMSIKVASVAVTDGANHYFVLVGKNAAGLSSSYNRLILQTTGSGVTTAVAEGAIAGISGGNFDLIADPTGGGRWAIAHRDVVSSTLAVRIYDEAGTAVDSNTFSPTNFDISFFCLQYVAGQGGHFVVPYLDDTNGDIRLFVTQYALTSLVSDGVIDTSQNGVTPPDGEPFFHGAVVENTSTGDVHCIFDRYYSISAPNGIPGRAFTSCRALQVRPATSWTTVVAGSAHEIAGCGLAGKGWYHLRYGAVFPVATGSVAGGIPWAGSYLNVTEDTAVVAFDHTPLGGNGFLVAFYTDLGGLEPDSQEGFETPMPPTTPSVKPVAIARFAVDRLGPDPHAWDFVLMNGAQVSADEFIVPLPLVFGFESVVLNTTQGVRGRRTLLASGGVNCYFGDTTPVAHTSSGETLLSAGGQVTAYDGTQANDLGLMTQPILRLRAFADGNEGNPVWNHDTDIFIEAVFRWRDQHGNVHRSGGSTLSVRILPAYDPLFPPPSIPTVGSLSVDVLLPPEIYLHREENFYRDIELEAYWSGAQGGEPLLREVFRLFKNIATDGDGEHAWFTIVAVPPVSETSVVPSYEAVGELGADVVPPMEHVIVAKNRVWGINRDDPSQVWPSKTLKDQQAAEFSAVLALNVPEDRDGFTGLAEMDDKVLMFKRDRIFVVSGDGPNDLGQGGWFGPKQLQTDAGALTHRSIVRTPAGTAFLSARGFMLAARDGTFVHIGNGPEGQFDPATDTCLSGTLVPEKNHVRWLVSVGGLEKTLTWDYERNLWTTSGERIGQHAILWDDRYTHASGTVIVREDTTTFLRGEGGIVLPSMTTGWIRLEGLPEGLVRVWRIKLLGRYYDNGIRVSVGYDDEDGFTDVVTWTETDLDGQEGEAITLSIVPSRQKSKSFRLKIQEWPDLDGEAQPIAVDSPWFTPAGITLEVGARQSSYKRFRRSPNQR